MKENTPWHPPPPRARPQPPLCATRRLFGPNTNCIPGLPEQRWWAGQAHLFLGDFPLRKSKLVTHFKCTPLPQIRVAPTRRENRAPGPSSSALPSGGGAGGGARRAHVTGLLRARRGAHGQGRTSTCRDAVLGGGGGTGGKKAGREEGSLSGDEGTEAGGPSVALPDGVHSC